MEVPVQSLSREELNLLEVVEDVALQALRRVQVDIKSVQKYGMNDQVTLLYFRPSTIPNFPVFVKSNTQENTNTRKKVDIVSAS